MCQTAYQGSPRVKSDFVSLRGRLKAAALVVLLSLGAAAAAAPFDVQGHRGARGLAPENTLTAFRTALDLGVTTLELDVGLTRDGHVVIAHDRRLNADITRDASGEWLAVAGPALHTLNTLTLTELQRHDVGRIRPGTRYAQTFPDQRGTDHEPMPTLDALFALVRSRGDERVRFNIETKLSPLAPEETASPEALVRALLTVVAKNGMQARVTVQSFDWRTLKLSQQLAPAIPTVALTVRQNFLDNLGDERWTAGLRLADHGGSVPRLVQAAGARVWSPYHLELSQALVADAQALGLTVIPWTVNAPEQIDRYIGWGVDGIISDYPDRVLQLLKKRGRTAGTAAQ